jgi:F-type H+-transporting ATPase subunit delta
MAQVSRDPEMKRLIQNPRVSRQEIAQVIADVCGSGVGEEGRNLLRLLAQNRRLHVLPAIADQYENLRAEAERTVQAELESALPVSDSEQQRIADALTARLGRKVELVCRINETLVGGAVIRAGDLVIDGSVRARLEKLAVAISG